MWKSLDGVAIAGRDCIEDLFGTSGDLAWILDGASAVLDEKRVTSAPTDARWMVENLDAHLRTLADSRAPLRDVVAEVILRTAAQAKVEWTGTPEVPPSAALGVVRHAGDCTEFLVLADVSVILRTAAGAHELTDRRVEKRNHNARRAMAEMLDSGSTFEEALERTRPHLAAPRRSAMNKDDGYWVASLDEGAASHALTGTLDDVDEIILATDGFMRALHLFRLVDDADALFEADFEDLARAIRRSESKDPETREYRRWTVSDDICAQRLRWID